MRWMMIVLAQAEGAAANPDAAQQAAPAAERGAERVLETFDAAMRSGDVDQVVGLLTEFLVEYGVRAIGALVFLVVAMIVGRMAGGFVTSALQRAHIELTLAQFLGKIVRILVLVLGVVTCLGIFGVPMTSFAAVIGAAGLGVALALQGSLANVAAGVSLALFRPFRVGDVVVLQGFTGVVKDIDLFTTRMDTFENRRIIIPNGKIFGDVIENITYNPVRRVEVPVGVEYSADLDRTRQVLIAAAEAVPGRVNDPAPTVVLNGLGASSVDWLVRVWCPKDDFLKVKDAATREVKGALDRAGIGIPFPQRVVHMVTTKE